MRSCDVSQQALFAQQPGWHAFSLATFVSMHGAAGKRTVAVTSASPTAADTVILVSITLTNSIISAAVIGATFAFSAGLKAGASLWRTGLLSAPGEKTAEGNGQGRDRGRAQSAQKNDIAISRRDVVPGCIIGVSASYRRPVPSSSHSHGRANAG